MKRFRRSAETRADKRALTLLAVLACLVAACDGAPSTEESSVAEAEEAFRPLPACDPHQAPTIDVTRSLAVVDLPTLGARDAQGKERFSLKRVLRQLANTSGATSPVAPIDLYQRLWDTNNTKAGGFVAGGQHCDDQKDAQGRAVLNGFPIQCPRQEGILADVENFNPFCSGSPTCHPYSPVAIVNRFDLAPSNGQNCGQYRIVFGKGATYTPVALAGNKDGFDRNLIIFEAILPNPRPSQGLAACGPVQEFWAALSAEDDPRKRAAALDYFYFKGIPGFAAAFRFDHFTGAIDPATGTQASGQIRANQFMFTQQGQGWQLREYNLERRCSSSGSHRKRCEARVKMVATKLNPEASLFDDANTSQRALAFRDPQNPKGFFSQIKNLAVADLNLMNMNDLGTVFNGGQSTSSPTFPDADGNLPPPDQRENDTNYTIKFKLNGPFANKLQDTLYQRGIKLGALHIVRRAQTQSCAGCHELSTSSAAFFGGTAEANKVGNNLVWPDAATGVIPIPSFTQTSEAILVPLSPGVTCDTTCTADPTTCQCAWAISPAMTDVFLPFRRDNMIKYLSQVYTGKSAWAGGGWGPAHARVKGSPDN